MIKNILKLFSKKSQTRLPLEPTLSEDEEKEVKEFGARIQRALNRNLVDYFDVTVWVVKDDTGACFECVWYTIKELVNGLFEVTLYLTTNTSTGIHKNAIYHFTTSSFAVKRINSKSRLPSLNNYKFYLPSGLNYEDFNFPSAETFMRWKREELLLDKTNEKANYY